MVDYSDCKKEFVVAHEWGHAQRLDHSVDKNILHKNILNQNILNQCQLGAHDKEDYRGRWGNQ